MKKEDVELIVFGILLNNQDVLKMKIFKNGIWMRQGAIGTPAVDILASSDTKSPDLFNKLMREMPGAAFTKPIKHEEENIKSPLVYFISFFGDPEEGDDPTQITYKDGTGMKFLIDNGSNFRHPGLTFIDQFAVLASQHTDSWYMDAVIAVELNLHSKDLPEQTTITSRGEVSYWEAYLQHMMKNKGFEGLQELAKDKIYIKKDTGKAYRLEFELKDEKVLSFNFVDVSA